MGIEELVRENVKILAPYSSARDQRLQRLRVSVQIKFLLGTDRMKS